MKSLSWDLGSSAHVVKELSMAPQRAANHTLLVQCPAIFFTKQCNPRQQVNRQLCVKFHADTWHDLLAVISLQKKQNLFLYSWADLGPIPGPSFMHRIRIPIEMEADISSLPLSCLVRWSVAPVRWKLNPQLAFPWRGYSASPWRHLGGLGDAAVKQLKFCLRCIQLYSIHASQVPIYKIS